MVLQLNSISNIDAYLSDLTGIGKKLRIYEEHLEEASFLYNQRLYHFLSQDLSWRDIGAMEERFERHISALVIGGHLAFDISEHKSSQGDDGEFHAALRVFLRASEMKRIERVLGGMNWDDEGKVLALTEAFKHELPDNGTALLREILAFRSDAAIESAAKIIGFRRLKMAYPLLTALENEAVGDRSSLIWALGRLNEKRAIPLMTSCLQNGSESEAYESAMALLRMGQSQITKDLLFLAQTADWAFLPLGFCSDPTISSTIMAIAESRTVDDHLPIALGLTGDLASLPMLLGLLQKEGTATASALALYLITGASLYEDIFIPDAVDEDTLFDEEKEKLKRGEPLYPEGKEPGETLNRLSYNPQVWLDWWRSHASRFERGLRYRMGRPFGIDTTLDGLALEAHDNILRKLLLEEVVIRYRMDIVMETDMTVRKQEIILGSWKKRFISR